MSSEMPEPSESVSRPENVTDDPTRAGFGATFKVRLSPCADAGATETASAASAVVSAAKIPFFTKPSCKWSASSRLLRGERKGILERRVRHPPHGEWPVITLRRLRWRARVLRRARLLRGSCHCEATSGLYRVLPCSKGSAVFLGSHVRAGEASRSSARLSPCARWRRGGSCRGSHGGLGECSWASPARIRSRSSAPSRAQSPRARKSEARSSNAVLQRRLDREALSRLRAGEAKARRVRQLRGPSRT